VIAEIARQWGTPAYVYDLAEVRRAEAELREALPRPSRLYYSLKANPHPAIVAELARLGCHAEVSSVGEFSTAREAGFAKNQIMLTGPGKADHEVAAAIALGARRFSVESPYDLAQVGAMAAAAGEQVDVLLRVNADTAVPGMGLSMTGVGSAFGVDASWIESAPERFIDSGGARVRGLHFYMGTQIEDVRLLLSQFELSLQLGRQLMLRYGAAITEIDLGGGFGAPFARTGSRPDLTGLRAGLLAALSEHLPDWHCRRPLVSFESGRFLTAAAGTLVCRVLDVKPSKDRVFVVLDAGIHQLGGMSGLRRLPRIAPTLLPMAGPPRGWMDDCSVVGPLCTPVDMWSSGVRLPTLEPGDLVAVPNVGAYGLTASLLAFIGHLPAAEVVHDGGMPVSATRLTLRRQPLTAGFVPTGSIPAMSRLD
jgi:diaminopimelate decarboxylase